MSYIVIRVYNFECDWPGCDVTNIEVVPMPATLREAVKILRETEYWTTRDGKHYCPKAHDAPVTGGPPMREGNNPRTGIAYNE